MLYKEKNIFTFNSKYTYIEPFYAVLQI